MNRHIIIIIIIVLVVAVDINSTLKGDDAYDDKMVTGSNNRGKKKHKDNRNATKVLT